MTSKQSRQFGWWLRKRQEAMYHLQLAAQSLTQSEDPKVWVPLYRMLYRTNTEFLDNGIKPTEYLT